MAKAAKRRRINITILDGVPDEDAIVHLLRVIRAGRISNGGKSYCYHSESLDGVYVAAARQRAGQTSDSFVIGEKL